MKYIRIILCFLTISLLLNRDFTLWEIINNEIDKIDTDIVINTVKIDIHEIYFYSYCLMLHILHLVLDLLAFSLSSTSLPDSVTFNYTMIVLVLNIIYRQIY